jgi:hypothetical protein
MGDVLTILRSLGPRLTKLWRADGTIEPYDRAKNFHVEEATVTSIRDLGGVLSVLEDEPDACIIRGTPKTGSPRPIRRLLEHFDDKPLHTILIEVDNYRPLLSDPLDGEDAALEYIAECLPEPFHDVSFWWQLSASAGAPGKEGLLKLHLWMWLETPYDSATLRAWAAAENLELDRAVMQPVQPHFTAAPVMEDGVVCPVKQRSGLWGGERDSVPLVIDVESLDVRTRANRQHGERLETDDALAQYVDASWETWGETPDGAILVTCPWHDEHSSGAKGDSSSAYFPAGTRGYSEGAYVCLHTSCETRGRGEFASAIGYTENLLADLALPVPHHDYSEINDPLLLPSFKRLPGGKIITSLSNVVVALGSPHVCGMRLRYDVFKDAIMAFEDGGMRPILDTDYTALRISLESRGLENVGREMIRDAVHLVADRDKFDSAFEWLDQQTWDGVPRIETFWVDHFGVPDDNRGYARAVGLYTWTALAGRVLVPGMQADMVPILTGSQGLGKSRGVAAMSPDREYVTSISFNEPEIERARKMRGRLIIELAELQGLKSREREEILAWVTRSDEHWTPKFMEMSVTYSRRSVLFGTTNDREFLDDPTGERRWLPLDTGAVDGFEGVDVDEIVRLRGQLWAEGRARYEKDGLQWRDAERLARDVHERYKADDSWGAAIAKWLDTPDMSETTPRQRKFLLITEVAEGALAIPTRHLKYSDQRRIGKVLRSEGFDSQPMRIGEQIKKVWMPK